MYNITSVKDYLNSIGKLNLYTSIIFFLGFITAIYMDKNKYSASGLILLIYFIFIGVLKIKFERKIKKYLLDKKTETIDR